MSDDDFENMVWAFYEASKAMIESEIGKLKDIEFKPFMVIFHGEKSAKKFHRKTLEKDLNWLNKQGIM